MSRSFVLDRESIILMLGDGKFYMECPSFMPMRAFAIKANEAYKDLQAKGGCGFCIDKRIVPQILTKFAAFTMYLTQKDPKSITAMKNYLSQRKGYRIDALVVTYHKKGSTTVKRISI